MRELSLYHKIAFTVLCIGAFTNTFLLVEPLMFVRLGVLLVLAGVLFTERVRLDSVFYAVCFFFFTYITFTLLLTVAYGRGVTFSDTVNFLFILPLIIALLWIFCSAPEESLRLFYWICCIFLGVSFIMAIEEMAIGWHLPMSNMRLPEKIMVLAENNQNYPTVFFNNKNDFAVVIALTFCYIMAYRIHFMPNRRKWVFVIYLTLCMSILCMVQCRTAFVAVAIFLLFTQRKQLLKYKVLFTFIGVIFLVGVVILFCVFHFGSTSIRTNLYLYSFVSMFESYCMGFGLKGNLFYYAQWDNYELFGNITDTHSYLLHFILTSGVVVFIGYIALLVYLMRKIATKHGRNEFWIMIPLYVLLLFAPSGANCLWIHYLFFSSFVGYACSQPAMCEQKI